MPRKPRNPSTLPARPPEVGLTSVQVRETLLLAAGLTPARQGELLAKAVATADEAVSSAMSVLNTSMPDWHARLGAAKFIRDLVGAAPPKAAAAAPAAQVAVVVNIPKWAQGEVIDASPNLG